MASKRRLRSLDEFERTTWHAAAWRAKPRDQLSHRTIIAVLGAAVIGGGPVGILSTDRGQHQAAIAATAVDEAIDRRARPPRPGDVWGGCNDARAAGSAPIYRSEPGYRADMDGDGDGDGVACEPIANGASSVAGRRRQFARRPFHSFRPRRAS